MQDWLKKKLVPIKTLQNIKGVQLPAGMTFVQLIVTGPPGAGKSFYIKKIHGWPNEGYIDLTRKGWWKDKSLVFRPREVHLGLPFQGVSEPLTVFDEKWLEAPEPLELELNRIQIPPEGLGIFLSNWRQRYVFEFLLPKARRIFSYRKARHTQSYFPVDEKLTLKTVRRQLAVYRQVALYLHRQGMQIYIRKSLDKPPCRIVEDEGTAIPRWATGGSGLKPALTTPAGWKWLLMHRDPINWITLTDQWQELPGESRIAYDGMEFMLKFGNRTLLFSPEIMLGEKKPTQSKNWLISDPDITDDRICGYIRLRQDETSIIGRTNEIYKTLFHLRKKVAKHHFQLRNERGDLIITPLHDEKRVELRRIDFSDCSPRIKKKRLQEVRRLRRFFGRTIKPLSPAGAIARIKTVNSILADEPFRPGNSSGRPGGLVEIPDSVQPVIIGDLHGQINNLLKILSENNILTNLERGCACLIILGDAVHSEVTGQLDAMESSMLIMDLIFLLKVSFPQNVFYLRGNHDSFSPEISKQGVPQGLLFQKYLVEHRGQEYAKEMEKFYGLLPFVIKSGRFVACHAAPPWQQISREELINLDGDSTIAMELITGRLKRGAALSGYGKSEVKRFRKDLGLAKRTPFIVAHTPFDSINSVWKHVLGIKGHHVIYSGRSDGPSVFIQIDGHMIPLRYPAEPILEIINKIR